MSIDKFTHLSLQGIRLSLVGMFACIVGLILAVPPLQAQVGPDVILPASKALAEALPTDFARLCLYGIIVLSMVLLATVTAFLTALDKRYKWMVEMSSKFAETIHEITSRPCLLESDKGEAFMRQALYKARRDAEEMKP